MYPDHIITESRTEEVLGNAVKHWGLSVSSNNTFFREKAAVLKRMNIITIIHSLIYYRCAEAFQIPNCCNLYWLSVWAPLVVVAWRFHWSYKTRMPRLTGRATTGNGLEHVSDVSTNEGQQSFSSFPRPSKAKKDKVILKQQMDNTAVGFTLPLPTVIILHYK